LVSITGKVKRTGGHFKPDSHDVSEGGMREKGNPLLSSCVVAALLGARI
jgi:hypothetical protein